MPIKFQFKALIFLLAFVFTGNLMAYLITNQSLRHWLVINLHSPGHQLQRKIESIRISQVNGHEKKQDLLIIDYKSKKILKDQNNSIPDTIQVMVFPTIDIPLLNQIADHLGMSRYKRIYIYADPLMWTNYHYIYPSQDLTLLESNNLTFRFKLLPYQEVKLFFNSLSAMFNPKQLKGDQGWLLPKLSDLKQLTFTNKPEGIEQFDNKFFRVHKKLYFVYDEHIPSPGKEVFGKIKWKKIQAQKLGAT